MTLQIAPFLVELTKRIRLEDLYRPFRDRYLELLVACHERAFDYFAISGFRSVEEQDALYALGRARCDDGSWMVTDAGKVVTKAQGGSSAHNFGIAADSCRDANQDRAGLQPAWGIADYQVLAVEAKRLGLEAAYFWTSFREGPHVQLPLLERGITHAHLRRLQEKGGQSAVWEFLDTVGPW